MSDTSTIQEDVLKTQINSLRALERERRQELKKIEELPELEKRHKALVAKRKGQEAYEQGLSEITAGILALKERSKKVRDLFLAVLDLVIELATEYRSLQSDINTLLGRTNYIARLSAHRRQHGRADYGQATAIADESMQLWSESGGMSDELKAFPKDAFQGDRTRAQWAHTLAREITADRVPYDPSTAHLVLRRPPLAPR